ncbi:YSIRK signal domain/LPXTG anchor domain surface protein [Gracilaria domingensis]|nr:YSIRK signal domain/LPXTG anchor domain surface protein [Gracilaria domingensis]
MSDRYRSTTNRCLGQVATALIAPDGGRPNLLAKTIATLWYLLILPDAQARFHRQVYRKRLPWYAPSRVFGLLLSAANIATIPLSWVLLVAGKRNASRIACFSVLLNPPTITLTWLLIKELSNATAKKTIRLGCASMDAVMKPFKSKKAPQLEGPATPVPENSSTTASTSAPKSELPVPDTPAPENSSATASTSAPKSELPAPDTPTPESPSTNTSASAPKSDPPASEPTSGSKPS